jgi:hypothetical protein
MIDVGTKRTELRTMIGTTVSLSLDGAGAREMVPLCERGHMPMSNDLRTTPYYYGEPDIEKYGAAMAQTWKEQAIRVPH